MHTTRYELGQDVERVEIHTFADLHIGDKHCDFKDIQRRLEYVRNTPNALVVLNGDLMNVAVSQSPSDTYGEQLTPMEQLQRVVDLFGDIKDRIIAVTSGNHENRTYKHDGVDLMGLACQQLGIADKYDPDGVFVFLQFGRNNAGGATQKNSQRKICYTLYVTHGSGGGRKEGGKAVRLADLAAIVDADIFIHGHTHLPLVMKEAFFRSDIRTHTVTCVDKLFVNCGSSLRYGGYGQAYAFKPNSIDTPVIYLMGGTKRMSAEL